MRVLTNMFTTTKGKALGFVALLVSLVAVSSPASAATSTGPKTVAEWSSKAVEFASTHIPEIGLALVAVAGATIVLAIGSNLLGRMYTVLRSLGKAKPVR